MVNWPQKRAKTRRTQCVITHGAELAFEFGQQLTSPRSQNPFKIKCFIFRYVNFVREMGKRLEQRKKTTTVICNMQPNSGIRKKRCKKSYMCRRKKERKYRIAQESWFARCRPFPCCVAVLSVVICPLFYTPARPPRTPKGTK